MTIKEQLRSNFPKTINKTAPIFSALVANDEGTGAFEYELNNLISYMNEWVGTPNVYEQSGSMLEKTVAFFSFLEHFTDEPESSLKNRFGAIFIRNHNEIWGNPYDVKTVFEQYFSNAEIYIVENTGNLQADNLIHNGDFADSSSRWILQNCNLDIGSRFSKTYGVGLYYDSNLKQTVNFANSERKTCVLHFFMKGKVRLRIKNSAGQYWNSSNNSWNSQSSYTEFECDKWQNQSIFFVTESGVSGIDIEFSGKGNDKSSIDYIRLFEKKPYASFTVIVHFEAESGANALSLAPGNSDPNENISDYRKYYYFDKAFLTGAAAGFAQDIYNDLLDLLRAQGVKAYLEIVTKDYAE